MQRYCAGSARSRPRSAIAEGGEGGFRIAESAGVAGALCGDWMARSGRRMKPPQLDEHRPIPNGPSAEQKRIRVPEARGLASRADFIRGCQG